MPSKPLRLYLDTSVPSLLFSPDDPEKQELTKSFFARTGTSKEHYLYVSYLTMEEIENTPDVEKKGSIKQVVSGLPVLESSQEATELADRYLKEGIVPAKYRDDALHLAIASTNDIDVVVSWNFDHIVRFKTKHGVTGINTLLGYKVIDIISPQELL